MIEAEIRCQCSSIALPDVGLGVLTKGQVVYMDATKARSSADLQRAWRAKAVTIKYVQRFQERREAPVPHALFVKPPSPRSMVAAPEEPEPQGHDILLVDPDAIAARVVAELGRSPVNERVKIEVARQIQELEDRLVARVAAAVLAAFRVEYPAGITTTRTLSETAGRVPVSGDVPVYVPSKIDGSLKADLGIEADKAGDEAVSGAAAALRAAREAGKKRRTETSDD